MVLQRLTSGYVKSQVPSMVVDFFDEKKIDYYQRQITPQKFFSTTEYVHLELTAWTGAKLILSDFLRWEIGRPEAYHIVCSPKFRGLLETFRLPEHRFYNAQIDVKGKKHHYFVLHFIHEWATEIDYSLSQFNVLDLLNDYRTVKTLSVGEITSHKNYNEVIQLMGESADDTFAHYLFPKKLHFLPTIQYDVWGLHGQIVLSPHAKNAIEKAGITGVDMPPLSNNSLFRDLEVVMSL